MFTASVKQGFTNLASSRATDIEHDRARGSKPPHLAHEEFTKTPALCHTSTTISISEFMVFGAIGTTQTSRQAKAARAEQPPQPNRREQHYRDNDAPSINCKEKTSTRGDSYKKTNPTWNPHLCTA
jgi:hypothetical protein